MRGACALRGKAHHRRGSLGQVLPRFCSTIIPPLQGSSTCFRKCTCTSFLHLKDMEKVCIGQTIDRIANITHQLARQKTLFDYFTH